MSFHKTNNVIGVLLCAAATFLYLYTLEPTASYWDSGEFIAAAYKLEIPHPPGAPLFLLVGRMFSFLSLGHPEWVAFSINAVSAVASGLTILFLYWSIVLLGQKIVSIDSKTNRYLLMAAGAVGALAYAFSDSFWNSATETEVYALSTFLTSVVFWCILKWETKQDPAAQNRWLILIAYLMGLSVGIHLLNLLTIPAIAMVYYFKKQPSPTVWGISKSLLISCLVLVGILYGLIGAANVAKSFELFFVNNLNMPFGSGALIFATTMLCLWISGIWKTQTRGKAQWNTALLAIGFIFIGYSSYSVILIRANQNPPINQNNPNDVLRLIYYLNMDQYPKRPLLYGRNFDAELIDQKQGKKVYEKSANQYIIKDRLIENIYEEDRNTLFPRMYSTFDKGHASAYRQIAGLQKGEKPSFSDNMQFMFSHQLVHMYWRYFLWNFAGKEGSFQNASWLSPLAAMSDTPSFLSNDRSRNNYLMLPLILGMIGIFFLYKKDKKTFMVLSTLFVMTGIAIVIYVNAPPIEPRERDYVYVGSYYAFCIAIGFGLLAVFNFLQEKIKLTTATSLIVASSMGMVVPAIMLVENFDDHNKQKRYYSIDQAKNMLSECEPNAILFTGGDNDTFPLWYAQEVEGFRTDVRVVVLSYANADWYIDQFYRKVNESEALPLNLTQDNYKEGGLNDYLPLVPNPKVKGAINLSQYLSLLKKESKAIQVQYGHSQLNTLPADTFYLKSDLEKKLSQIPSKFQDLGTPKMEFKIKGRAIHRNDLVILDLMDTNRWERPIYFNYTSLNSINLDLKDHVIQQGNTYKLVPVQKRDPDQNLIDEERMFDNFVTHGRWRGLDNPDVYYNDYYKSAITAQRQYFNELTEALLDTGKIEKAKQTLKKSTEVFPDATFPYDFANVNTAQLFLAIHDKDSADHIAQKLTTRADEYLDYAIKHAVRDQQELSRNLYTLRQLALIYNHYGYNEQGAMYAKQFEKHYEKLNG